VSREALSLDISQLVSRVVAGEAIDVAEKGAALAAKYPDLGMSGELIAQAIERAAGMVGMIRTAPAEPRMSPVARDVPAPTPSPAGNGHSRPVPKPASVKLPVAVSLIDDDLAAAIDAEIGSLVTSGKAASTIRSSVDGDTKGASSTTPAATDGPAGSSFISKAFKRALFRS
jgi:hypothetical protein